MASEVEDPDRRDFLVIAGNAFVAVGAAVTLWPFVAQMNPDAGAQAAWYTLTPDSQAVIGPCPEVDGLFLVSGFSGHGFKLAPSVGEGVAQMLAGEPISAFDAEFFSPSRFDGQIESREHRPFGL